ncbi:MAG: cyclase family protein [Candidatus Obscuribacterales bacterium]|nr:cyclase family protein [Candidatus Obscuribacterales bacterium]
MAKARRTLLLSMLGAMSVICGAGVERAWAAENNLDSAIASNKIIDLTHVLGPGLPDFHEGAVSFTYEPLYSVKKNGYANGKFCTPEHYGTHVDAPTHFFDGKASIDKLQVETFVRPCVVIDVRDEVKADPDYLLTPEKIQALEKKDKFPTGSVVLLLTGWGQRWQDATAYRNVGKDGSMHYPSFGAAAADYLIKHCHVQGLGVDTISADYGLSRDYPVHKLVLGQGLYLIENIANLEQLPARGATLICAPLPIKDGTGSPARIMAIVPSEKY